MRTGNELVDMALVVLEERVDISFVELARALGLWKDQVEEEEKADISVEGDPIDWGLVSGVG